MDKKDKKVEEEYKLGLDYYEEVEEHKCCGKCNKNDCCKDEKQAILYEIIVYFFVLKFTEIKKYLKIKSYFVNAK